MKSFSQYQKHSYAIGESLPIEPLLSEEVKLTDFDPEVLDGFSVEKHKKSSSRTTVFVVKTPDRESDRDELVKNLKDAGIEHKVIGSSMSSFDPVEVTGMEGGRCIFLFKPKAGGMSETTLNSSITELFPCMAWEKGYTPKNATKFYEWIIEQDPNKFKCVGRKDKEAAVEFIGLAEDSSKFVEKMEAAIGIHKYLKDENKEQKIKQVYWGYRAKPFGIDDKHPGDIYLEFVGKKPNVLGVSLKAGTTKSAEPKLNTYVNPVFQFFKSGKEVPKLSERLHKEVYSKIEGMPSAKTYDGKDKETTEDILDKFLKSNSTQYEKLYDAQLEIVRTTLIDLFNKHGKQGGKSFDYIKSAILREAPNVPTKVIKGIGTSYEQVTDDDELGVFLPVVKFLKARPSGNSKQNWFIDLQSKDTVITMKMTVRSNKSGHGGKRKLGQFYNLAVKYNGLEKK
jgi:hypothetical protein